MSESGIGDYIYLFSLPARERLRHCRELESKGPMGRLASMLYRTLNASMLVDLYENIAPICGEPYIDDPKNLLERNLHGMAMLLCGSSDFCGIRWGWWRDDRCEESPWVLSIDLPTGKVQYRTMNRGQGPEHEKRHGNDPRNVNSVELFCESVLNGYLEYLSKMQFR